MLSDGDGENDMCLNAYKNWLNACSTLVLLIALQFRHVSTTTVMKLDSFITRLSEVHSISNFDLSVALALLYIV